MHKPQPADDLRVQRTRKLIQEAFISLTVEKGFAALTVRDITQRARINRSTFYRHFLDKYDLLERYMDELYGLVSDDAVLAEKLGQAGPETNSGLVSLLRHVQSFGDFYRAMLGPQGEPLFTERFRQNTERRFRAFFANIEPAPDAPPVELRVNYVSYAGVGAIIWWLNEGCRDSPEQVARWLGQLFPSTGDLVLKAKQGR